VRILIQVDELHSNLVQGGGTSGCVLANRLSQGGDLKILLLERGERKDGWFSRVPLFSQNFMSDDARQIPMKSTPQAQLGDRAIELVQCNTLGGATTLNAMLYTRGIPAEYNSWQCKGWAYDDMQPYFIRSETVLDNEGKTQAEYHGTAGKARLQFCVHVGSLFSAGEWQNRSHEKHHWGHTP
jgi:choline dehydrogenase-like flavoprotein